MAIKTYGVHDQWVDLDRTNDVEIKSTDGVIDSVKINGEEQGGGGGGSSDLSTAIVTLRLGETSVPGLEYASLNNTLTLDDEIWTIEPETLIPPINTTTKTVVLYQGKTYLFDNMIENAIESVEGNITYDDDNVWYVITGDCTVVLAGEGTV